MPRIPNAYHMAPLDAETLDVSTHEEVDSNPSQDHASPRSTRPPSLAMDPRHPSIRILNSLTPETCSRTEDVGLTASIPENRVPKSAAVLVQAKAVVLFMVGGRSYAALTASGAKHLSYDKSAEKAPVADLQADYGTPRTLCIQMFSRLGTLRTCDITAVLPVDCFAHSTASTGHLIQQFRQQGLIREVLPRLGSIRYYTITNKGHTVAATLAPFIIFPSADELRERLKSGRRVPAPPTSRSEAVEDLPSFGRLLSTPTRRPPDGEAR